MELALSVKGERYRRVTVKDYADACRTWLKFHAEANFGAGFGGSAMTRDCGQLYEAGKPVAYVSYNGRVWRGTPQAWKSGDKPMLEPVEDVCIAGAPAILGVCGDPDCVCA